MLISLGVLLLLRPIVYSQRKRKLLQLILFLAVKNANILVLPFHNPGKLRWQESRKVENICKFSRTECFFFFLENIRIGNLNDP